MGVFDFVKNGVREMMIARPDGFKSLIVYKHPDQNFPMYSQLTVDSDEVAVFFRDGRVVGILPPGRHTLQTENIPFLNQIVNTFTGGRVFLSEIYFVKTAPLRGVPFGGPIGTMRDPQLMCLVTPRIFGEMSLVVTEPVQFIVGYVGQAAAGDNDKILAWLKGIFMNGVKQTLGEFCVKQKVTLIDAIAYTTELAQAFVNHVPALNDIGVRVLQMGAFNINFSPEDDKKLNAANERFVASVAEAQRDVQIEQIRVAQAQAKAQQNQFALDQKYNQDARYVQNLAGNYANYAAGQAMIGAGEGMASHGVGGGIAGIGAQMGVGVAMAQGMAGAMPQFPQPGAQPQPSQPQFTPTAAATVTCGKCQTKQPGGKFCAECGTALAQAKRFCTGCGTEIGGAAKFCANCGTAAAPAT
ncbi:MAG TPA: SPFH domain-containing protein [Polyangiaceae bacterium]|jgi:membrane protease subunit (stomatin/prohibitin family)